MLMMSLFIVFSGGWVFVSMHKHLLVMLISLEMTMLGLYVLLGMWSGGGAGEEYLLLVFLAFAACEGAVGLGVLVGLVRSHGNENFSSFSVLQC
uniref:NADH-ubiquinone oxidoreductase chain 4L n=1 Tax=Cermatobius longicornis TaxID=1273176 RepID=R4ISS3_9MYRI|nr:NADH dehydrogenase subunit 4L [Cermatobius longicornis]AGA84608.1 NADH dehydrogenase subunit 4L [Cermatobius longicornis]